MMPRACLGKRRAAGFTLLEAIVAIVITGILSAMVAKFIAGPVTGYVDSARRAELTDTADLVLRRLSREVRQALPNSLRVSTASGVVYIEFIATSGGGAYRSEQDGSTGNPLNFSDSVTTCTATPSKCQFDVLGKMPANPAITAGDYIVVYNLGQDANGNSYAPADAYPCGAATAPVNCNMARVSATPATADNSTVTLVSGTGDKNVFASQTPPLPSPSNRFHVVPGSVKAVAFSCPASTSSLGYFYRYANYGFFSTAAAASTAALAGAPADRITLANYTKCSVTYTAAASQRNGLLSVTLTMSNALNAESITLMREIHLDNSP